MLLCIFWKNPLGFGPDFDSNLQIRIHGQLYSTSSSVNDAVPVLPILEARVGEEEEEVRQLRLLDVVRQEPSPSLINKNWL